MNPILAQTFYYFIAMVIGIMALWFLMRDFLFKFLKVKASLGKLILVKVRSNIRDYYKVAKEENGFLVWKTKTGENRVSITDNTIFYRLMNCLCVDFDEKTSAFVKPDFTAVSSYDPEKYDNLYKKTLYRPSVDNPMQKYMFFAVIGCIIAVVFCIIIVFIIKGQVTQILANTGSIQADVSQLVPTVVGGTTI